jgi:hypothetical protein
MIDLFHQADSEHIDRNELQSILNVNKVNPLPVFGSAKGMFTIMPGFNEPLEDFKEYMY